MRVRALALVCCLVSGSGLAGSDPVLFGIDHPGNELTLLYPGAWGPYWSTEAPALEAIRTLAVYAYPLGPENAGVLEVAAADGVRVRLLTGFPATPAEREALDRVAAAGAEVTAIAGAAPAGSLAVLDGGQLVVPLPGPEGPTGVAALQPELAGAFLARLAALAEGGTAWPLPQEGRAAPAARFGRALTRSTPIKTAGDVRNLHGGPDDPDTLARVLRCAAGISLKDRFQGTIAATPVFSFEELRERIAEARPGALRDPLALGLQVGPGDLEGLLETLRLAFGPAIERITVRVSPGFSLEDVLPRVEAAFPQARLEALPAPRTLPLSFDLTDERLRGIAFVGSPELGLFLDGAGHMTGHVLARPETRN